MRGIEVAGAKNQTVVVFDKLPCNADCVLQTVLTVRVAGDNSHAVRQMMEKFPKVKHVLLENTGHNSFIEAEQAVYQHICEFLG